MTDIANKIIELRVALRRICMCESSEKGKSTLSLKTKVLFLIEKGLSSKDIIATLNIAKTNLALITNSLAENGLITKRKKSRDRREKAYLLTDAGEDYLNECRENINSLFKSVITSDDDNDDACNKIDEVLNLLSFVGY